MSHGIGGVFPSLQAYTQGSLGNGILDLLTSSYVPQCYCVDAWYMTTCQRLLRNATSLGPERGESKWVEHTRTLSGFPTVGLI